MSKGRLREVDFFVKVTQLGGDRIPFKPRQSDARACSGGPLQHPVLLEGSREGASLTNMCWLPGSGGAVAVAIGLAEVGGLLAEVGV